MDESDVTAFLKPTDVLVGDRIKLEDGDVCTILTVANVEVSSIGALATFVTPQGNRVEVHRDIEIRLLSRPRKKPPEAPGNIIFPKTLRGKHYDSFLVFSKNGFWTSVDQVMGYFCHDTKHIGDDWSFGRVVEVGPGE